MTSEKEMLTSLISSRGACSLETFSCRTCICNTICGANRYQSTAIPLSTLRYNHAQRVIQAKYADDAEMINLLFEATL